MDTTILLYIVIGIIVLGLIIVGIGVGILIAGIKEPMKEMKGRVNNLKERMDKLNLEVSTLTHTANELKEDMQSKSENVGILIDAAKGTKNSVLDLNSTVGKITGNISKRVDHDIDNVAEVRMWSKSAMGLLNLLDKRKTSVTSDDSYYQEPQTDAEPEVTITTTKVTRLT